MASFSSASLPRLGIEKGYPESIRFKYAGKNQKNMPCFLYLYCYLVAFCRQKRKDRLLCSLLAQKAVSCVQLENLLMGE